MSRAYDLVIFDLDGTLCDTAPDIERCLNRAMREFGLPEVPRDRVLKAIGPGGRGFYQAIMPEDMVSRGEDYLPLAEKVVERYRAHYTASTTELTRPFPGVVEALDALREMGVAMAVASNKPQAQTRKIVAELGLNPYFHEVIGPESVARPKPMADMLVFLIDRTHSARNRTLVVGDTDNDMLAGRAARVTTAFVTWGYRALAEMDRGTIDIVAGSPWELVEIAAGASRKAPARASR